MKLNGYLLLQWVDSGGDSPHLETVGVILARTEDSAKWAARLKQVNIKYDVIREMEMIDNDSTIFRVKE